MHAVKRSKKFWLVALIALFIYAWLGRDGARSQTGPLNILNGTVNLSSSGHTLPAKVVANTGALPATGCTPGELAVVTGATLGQQIYQNSGSGACVWTQQLNSGSSSGGGISVYSGTNITVVANTYYFPVGGGGSPSTTETNVDIDSPAAATITNFYAQLSVALGMGNTGVFTLRKNASSQSVTCTISGAAATSCNDTTHSFSVSQGDLLTVQLVTTGTIVVTPNVMFAMQFGNITATGTVNTGTAGQITYYFANGSAVGGATVTGAVKAGNPPTQAACADLSNGAASCSTDTTNASNITTGLLNNGRYYGSLCPGSTSFVSTDETTASTTYVDLATADSCTFTLNAVTSVLIQYEANTYCTGGACGSFAQIMVDGTLQASSETDSDLAVNTGAAANCQFLAASLPAGPHTVKVQHKTNANTVHLRKRIIKAFATLP